jgi:hypothetical protein
LLLETPFLFLPILSTENLTDSKKKPGADFFSEIDSIDVQGVPYFTNVAVQATAQGLYKPLNLLVNTTVTTGTLSIVIRQASNAVPGGVGTDINAIQIVPGGPGYIRSIPGHMP